MIDRRQLAIVLGILLITFAAAAAIVFTGRDNDAGAAPTAAPATTAGAGRPTVRWRAAVAAGGSDRRGPGVADQDQRGAAGAGALCRWVLPQPDPRRDRPPPGHRPDHGPGHRVHLEQGPWPAS